MSKIKQIIILRKDLNMRKGKCVAQGCHASVQVCMDIQSQWCPDYGFSQVQGGPEFNEWCNSGMTKICVGVDSEQELTEAYDKAIAAGLSCSIITDAGTTEFHGVATKTAVAIGPGESSEIDKITGELKLL